MPRSLSLASGGYLPYIDHDRLARYADHAFRRAASVGARLVVFASGGARQSPDGWSHAEGG